MIKLRRVLCLFLEHRFPFDEKFLSISPCTRCGIRLQEHISKSYTHFYKRLRNK
jgi:hypothetical protein